MTDYLELAKQVVAKAAQDGYQAEAYIEEGTQTEITVDRGQVEQLSQSGTKGIGIRVINLTDEGGKTGYSYTSDFSDASLDTAIATARELSEVATADPDRSLPELQQFSDEDLEIYDPELADVSTEDKITLVKQIEQIALNADPRMILAKTQYGDAERRVYLANSNGFAGTYDATFAYSVVMGVARDEASGDQADGYGIGFSTRYRDLNAEQIGQEAAYRTALTLGANSIPTSKMTVVFDPFVMGELLAYLSFALNAQSMQRGRSFLVGKMGQTVGSDKMTLLDDGRMKGGMMSAPFDDEGVPTNSTRLIDEGVLQAVIYDTYSARVAGDGAMSTGNGRRGSFRGMPSASASNFYIQPGYKSRDEIIAEVENGLYVTRIMQTGGINPVNGDCSMAASGQLIENGQLTRPVNGVTVATTLPELMMNISDVGKDLQIIPIMGAIGAPTVRVDGLTIGGS